MRRREGREKEKREGWASASSGSSRAEHVAAEESGRESRNKWRRPQTPSKKRPETPQKIPPEESQPENRTKVFHSSVILSLCFPSPKPQR